MDPVINIYYVHSSVCWESAQVGLQHFSEQRHLFISARNFHPPVDCIYHVNYDAPLSAYNSIALGLELNKTLADVDSEKLRCFRLFVPHAIGPIQQLFAAHESVKEVYFLEEGDLSYDYPFQQFPKKFSFPNSNQYEKAAQILAKNGFNPEHIRNAMIYLHSDYIFNLHGKYKGVCKIGANAFPSAPGLHIAKKLSLRYKNFENSNLLILPPATDPSCRIWLEKHQGQLMRGLEEIPPGFIFRRHPSCRIWQYPAWITQFLAAGIDWQTFDLGSKSFEEPARFKFRKVYVMGESSAERYLRTTQPDLSIVRIGGLKIFS